MKISDIIIGVRHRQKLGDIDSLALSISDLGLLHPIVIRPDKTLIAGRRRLEACKRLGWDDVPVTVIDLAAIVRGEFDENVVREDFAPRDMVSVGRALEEEHRVAAKTRHDEQAKRNFVLDGENLSPSINPKETAELTPVVEMPDSTPQTIAALVADAPGKTKEKNRTRNRVAAAFGRSGVTYEKAKAVAEAAEADPEKFEEIAEEMDRTGNVNGAFRKVQKAKDEKRILSIVPIVGKFRTLVIDPPWDYEGLSLAARAAPDYAVMDQEALKTMPVPQWAEDDCHLYLWTTNNFVPRAVELVSAWGFQYKTMLTWIKPNFGMGAYFRNTTEQVLFAVRGKVRTRSDSIRTHFAAEQGIHSAKPEAFYDIVRKSSYPSFGEAFQRTARDDFTNVYREIIIAAPAETPAAEKDAADD